MSRAETETTGATNGCQGTTWRTLPFRLRIFAIVLTVVCVIGIIAWFDTDIWRAHRNLQSGFTAIKAEKFYFGVHFRVTLRKMMANLLDYRLTGNPRDRELFRQDARQLRQWLRQKELGFVGPAERASFTRLESAYERFLEDVNSMLNQPTVPPPGQQDFAVAYAEIRKAAQPVLKACDNVALAEHDEFDIFLQESERSLNSLQRWFGLSLVLLIALVISVGVLFYRGMIAPLRAQLTESQVVIARQEKLAALGALGTGVAHEIRNPLTAIKFRLFSLKKSLPQEFSGNEDARVINEEISRLDLIVKDFLQFAKPSEPELVPVPAERVLKEVQNLMGPELKPISIEMELEILRNAWVRADTAQLKQVLINLVQNSADSIQHGGRITLGLHRAATSRNGHSAPSAILSVSDTGRGIPREVERRLFDPFFTTKQGGSGLGLAIAARIVEKHGGVLRYKTELNRGTTFEIVLPELNDDAS